MRMSSEPCTAASALATSVLPTPASPSISNGRLRASIIHSAVARSRSATYPTSARRAAIASRGMGTLGMRDPLSRVAGEGRGEGFFSEARHFTDPHPADWVGHLLPQAGEGLIHATP